MKKILLTLILCLFSLSLWSAAGAMPLTLKLSDGIITVEVADGSGLDWNSAVGAVTFVGSIGAWSINVSTGLSSPVFPTLGHMDLNTLNYGTGTLTVSLSDDFDAPSFPGWTFDVGGTTAGTVTSRAFLDAGGGLFVKTAQLGSTLDFASTPFSGSTSGSVGLDLDGTYSITIETAITHATHGNTSFDAELTPVPEAATMLLLGSGLIGLAGFGRRKFFKN